MEYDLEYDLELLEYEEYYDTTDEKHGLFQRHMISSMSKNMLEEFKDTRKLRIISLN